LSGDLLVEDDGPVVVLTLSSPAKRNALDVVMCDALVAALASLPARGARAAVLRGDPAGRAFSAGFDLAALGEAAADPEAAQRIFERVLEAIAASPVPLVAALTGPAMGGGCEIAAACDLRVAHAAVKLGLPPARLGIVYPTRGLARFSALCGEARARQLFLLARTIAADEAHTWGLVDFLVPEGEVAARARALAGELAAHAPQAIQGMRLAFEALLRRRATLEGDDAEEIARRRAAAWRSADAAEALAAIAEKRVPRFSGR
jgi:enoyl-CoA hydratase